MQLLISPLTVFSLGMPEMQFSHICIESRKQHLFIWCEDPFIRWGGGGSAIYNWLLFQYL